MDMMLIKRHTRTLTTHSYQDTHPLPSRHKCLTQSTAMVTKTSLELFLYESTNLTGTGNAQVLLRLEVGIDMIVFGAWTSTNIVSQRNGVPTEIEDLNSHHCCTNA